MNPVSVKNVQVLNSECPFSDPFQFEIEFECLQPLEEGTLISFFFFLAKIFFFSFKINVNTIDALMVPDLEWKFIYVGSAESESCDQELDCVMVGPVAVGDSKFTVEVGDFFSLSSKVSYIRADARP